MQVTQNFEKANIFGSLNSSRKLVGHVSNYLASGHLFHEDLEHSILGQRAIIIQCSCVENDFVAWSPPRVTGNLYNKKMQCS